MLFFVFQVKNTILLVVAAIKYWIINRLLLSGGLGQGFTAEPVFNIIDSLIKLGLFFYITEQICLHRFINQLTQPHAQQPNWLAFSV